MRDYGQRPRRLSSKATPIVVKKKFNSQTVRMVGGVLIGVGILWAVIGWIQTRQAVYISPETYENPQQNLNEVGEMLPMDNPTEALSDGLLPSSSSVDELKNKIQRLTDGKMGRYGWYVQSLVTGSEYGNNHNFVYTAASVNKVPIVLSYLSEVENGKESLARVYRLTGAHKEEGTGSLQYEQNGTEFTYEELIQMIGKKSDNTAVNALVAQLGEETIQDYIDGWGMSKTNLNENTSTPKEMGELFGLVYHDRIVKDPLKELFFTSLTNTDFEDRIPAGLPDGTRVAHKIGNQIQVWNDCGIVFAPMPYTLCMMTDGTSELEAQEVLPAISRMVWDWETRFKD